MKTNWVYKQPIDFEHKQYVLLDYYQKIQKEFDDLKLYPSFQQVTLHLANISSVKNKNQYMSIGREFTEPDDEIMLNEIKYHTVRKTTPEERKVILEVSDFARDKLTSLFMIGKSLWEIVNESVSLKLVKNSEQIMTGNGYIKFNLDNTLYIYEYRLRPAIDGDFNTQKCFLNKIYEGEPKGLYQTTVDNTKFYNPEISKEDLVKLLPLFEASFDNKYPLVETIVPMIRRKIANYILQTVKINEIKEIVKDGNSKGN
jgi:hypothetical protein